MSIYNHLDYKEFVRTSVKAMPKNGRGEWGRMAQKLGVNSTMISQIFNGEKNLSLEQAVELIDYWGLNDLEGEYFLLLLQYERAGSAKLKKRLKRKIDDTREQSKSLKNRMPHKKVLASKDQARFYSHWAYSATRILSSIEQYNNVNAIAAQLNLPVARVKEVADFLVATGLCREHNGTLEIGTLRTHLEANSILISSHHRNWRERAIERSYVLDESELMFSGPLTLSEKDFADLKTKMLSWIEEVGKVVEKSKPEKAAVFNLDFFELKR